jgi:hypothetical protein
MPCGMYGALTEAGCGVMGVTVVGGSGVGTQGGATSLEFNLGATNGNGTSMGITLCEHRGASEGERTGVGTGCCGIRVWSAVPCCTVLLNCEEFCDNRGAFCLVRDGSAAEKISESWRSACPMHLVTVR